MLELLISLLFISSAYGAGEFSVLHSPESLTFKGHDHVRESTLKEVYSAALGFSTEHYSNWQGLYIENPFDLPEAIVTVSVDGVADIGQQTGHHYPLRTDEEEVEIYQSLERRISERFPEQNTNLVRIDLSNGLDEVKKYAIFEEIRSENPKHVSHKSLKLDVDEDRQFLKEITLLREITRKIEQGVVKQDHVPDVFWFRVSALHPLSDLHGENSTETTEAKQLLNEAILRLKDAFVKAYDDKALVNVITSDASHTRRTRSILQISAKADEETDKVKYNLASYYSKDYPVIFNIILWFGIAMLFSLIAICLAIGNMDPGRDSIIYRMTSTRMKKDN
ncbi:renin receptor [Anoplophora glabripennis]|uniref:renin receptor n=1 Tax=Anoplophora glabripennis TaxID=217634 RepID=UPI0008740FBC|nr:renin receptor [Anoplophora glabripennis]